jgi:hypothetical protein
MSTTYNGPQSGVVNTPHLKTMKKRKKRESKKSIILDIIKHWMKEAAITDWMEFEWGRKRFKIKRIE